MNGRPVVLRSSQMVSSYQGQAVWAAPAFLEPKNVCAALQAPVGQNSCSASFSCINSSGRTGDTQYQAVTEPSTLDVARTTSWLMKTLSRLLTGFRQYAQIYTNVSPLKHPGAAVSLVCRALSQRQLEAKTPLRGTAKRNICTCMQLAYMRPYHK